MSPESQIGRDVSDDVIQISFDLHTLPKSGYNHATRSHKEVLVEISPHASLV